MVAAKPARYPGMNPAREEVPIKCVSIAAFVCRVTDVGKGMDVLLIRRFASLGFES